VMPDHEVHYGWRDVAAGKDLELELALALIARATPSPAR
jgi:hypothetical protein